MQPKASRNGGSLYETTRVFLLALVLCVTTPALAQSARDLEADRLADKLWRILDITKQYQPQFQAYVTLEAPDGARVALTFQGESARTIGAHLHV